MPVSISFYKPVDYFSGAFNKFVTWFTSGEYCHCELVMETTPAKIMNTVKEIYNSAQKGEYSPEDCQRIISNIEVSFFDTHFRKKIQSSDSMVLSFSLLWGSPMTVRVLTETAHDTWFKMPDQENVILKHMEEVTEEQEADTLKFAIEELGKNYDTSGALCSWMPVWNSSSRSSYESYFCSEFIVTAFQRIGFMNKLSAKHTTPNSLYHYIQNS